MSCGHRAVPTYLLALITAMTVIAKERCAVNKDSLSVLLAVRGPPTYMQTIRHAYLITAQ
jgi:hypothetical protein